MKCPACALGLEEKQLGILSLHVCLKGCGGIWFDTLEMDQVDQETEAVSELVFSARPAGGMTVDPLGARGCPRCEGVQLKRVLLSPGSQVHVCECPSCDGCWLDERELAKLHDERIEMMNSGRIEKPRTGDLIRYLYEVRTGRRNR